MAMQIYKLKQIETPRLIIRPVKLGDEYPLNKAVNNSLESLQKWHPWAKDSSIEARRGFVQRGVFAWKSCSIMNFPMVVIHKKDQKIIAASGYNDRSDVDQNLYEIGYWCDIDYQGKGYVTEYANALTKYAFDYLNASKVVISMQTKNSKSIAVAKRLRFSNEGTKEREPLDCISMSYDENYIYSASSIELLPDLEVSWSHVEHYSFDPEIISWAKKELKITNDKEFAASKVILNTPWSSVMAINTGKEIMYLKHMPDKIALEAAIIKQLRSTFKAPVPEVVADNKNLHCFLMKNAGTSLRTLLKREFNTNLLCRAIEQFTRLQVDVAKNAEPLLKIGVPDWRLNKLTDLFENLLEQQDLLTTDGLSLEDIAQLKLLLPKVYSLCEKLSNYSIGESLVQPDFQDNNILFDEHLNTLTHIDLGEIVIAHPFFSLVLCLRQMNKHYNLQEDDTEFLTIQSACLKSFMAVETEDNILSAFKISKLLWYVYEVLAQYRLIQSCDRDKIMSFQHGKLSKTLRSFITACENNEGRR